MRRALSVLVVAFSMCAAPVARAADEFVFDAGHTLVMFAADHFGFTRVFGRFNDVDGQFTIDRENATNNSVSVKINAASLDTGVADRDKHLRSPDFFNVGEHPAITFESTGVTFGDGDALRVAGNLTMLGVTKPVALDLKINKVAPLRGALVAGISGSLVVKRSEFGMSFLSNGIGDEIQIWIEVEGKKQG